MDRPLSKPPVHTVERCHLTGSLKLRRQLISLFWIAIDCSISRWFTSSDSSNSLQLRLCRLSSVFPKFFGSSNNFNYYLNYLNCSKNYSDIITLRMLIRLLVRLPAIKLILSTNQCWSRRTGRTSPLSLQLANSALMWVLAVGALIVKLWKFSKLQLGLNFKDRRVFRRLEEPDDRFTNLTTNFIKLALEDRR